MRHTNSVALRGALLAGAAILTPAGAFAQTAPSAQSTAQPQASQSGSEEIVVTAQHRTEKLQDVPISAQVVSGDRLQQQNITSLEDVSRTTASIHLVGTVGRSGALFIRGVGSGNNPAFDQSVSTFVDGIYHGRARMAANTFLDLGRVEILKGPQSTFFGNNAIAGALNIVTQQPSETFDGWARALYGEDGQYALEGAMGGPITDTLAVRAAVTFNGGDGWLKNVTTGRSAPELDNQAGRISFLFRPNNDFDATLKLEQSRNRNLTGFSSQVADCPPPAPYTTPRGFCPTIISTGSPTGFHNDQYARNGGERVDLDTHEAVLTLNYNQWGNTFTSITGYYDYDNLLNLDADLTPVTLQNAHVPETYGQLSQEFRVASPTGGAIEYLAGIYYQTDWLWNELDFNLARLSGPISANPGFAALVPYLPLGQTTVFKQNERIYSVFGSLTWNATDQLKFNAGLRGSWVNKDFNWRLYYGTATHDFGPITPLPPAIATLPNALGAGIATSLASDRSDNAWMPSLQVQYALTPNVNTYLSYSRGFKAGGFNYADVSGVLANLPFRPETVNAFEAGLKSELFDRRLVFNVALFHSDYADLQTSVSVQNAGGAFVSIVNNAGQSVSQGVEVETRWTPNAHFHLGADITYLDSHYVKYPNASTTTFQQLELAQCLAVTPAPALACNAFRFQDLGGKTTQNAPRWSGSVNADYSMPIGGDFMMTTDVSVAFATRQYYNPVADPIGRDDGYTRLDARLTLETPQRHWAFDILGQNLTNAVIFDYLQPMAGGSLGSKQFLAQQPRHFAVQVRYQW